MHPKKRVNPISCSPSDLFRTKERQKSIDIESMCQLLDLVLGSQFRAQVDYFIEYLKIQSDYKVINLDQWMGFFRFCNEVRREKISERMKYL
uniref:Defective in cullin neddylation protein n=1 Tax=Gossypium raimondii TaxID=29730 RepID=A0A0D2PQF4_GOSRA|nr:hypothetical protein B456_001G149700 [Gossypium raimondii]